MQALFLRIVTLGMLPWVLVSCSSLSLGIRPNEADYQTQSQESEMACPEFRAYAKYTMALQEAYHSRASLNRFSIYASGTTGLATITATAALAAASSPSLGTLALISLGGGFATGLFALADNPTLADIYTIAANRLETARQVAEAKLQPGTDGKLNTNHVACKDALDYLRQEVVQAKNNLERARTDSAVAALQRAAEQAKKLNKLADDIKKETAAQVVLRGEITTINPSQIDEVTDGKEREITLTTTSVDPALITQNDVRVIIGGQTISATWNSVDPNIGRYAVKFKAPAKCPYVTQAEYSPILLVGSAERRVETKQGVVLKYKNCVPKK
jgi:hypothetical protein